MRLIILLASIFCLASLVSQHAQAQQRAGTAPCGIPVFIYQTGMGGMSTINGGQPVILIDPQVAGGDRNFLTFTLFHECGHFANGDLLPQGMVARMFMSAEQELKADCYAAEHVQKSVSQAVAQIFVRTQGNRSPAPGYPTGNERAQNILECAGLTSEDSDSQEDNAANDASCPGLPPGMSLTCRFTRGPRAGQVQNFCGMPARPAPIGGPCTDGTSFGVAE